LARIDVANSTQACASALEGLPLDSVSGIAADAEGRMLVAGQRAGGGIVLILDGASDCQERSDSRPALQKGATSQPVSSHVAAPPPDEAPPSRSQAPRSQLLAGRPSFAHAVPGGWLVGGGAAGTGFVSLLERDGATRWTYRVPDSGDSYFRDATPDGAGGFWAIGQFAGSAAGYASRGLYDLLLVHLSATGGSLATRRFGSAGGEQGRAVVALADGAPVIAGEFGGALGPAAHPEIDFGSGRVRTLGDTDAFVAAPDRWTRTAGARGNDEYQALARFDEDVIAAGHTQPDLDYGTQNPHELTTFQAMLARYGPDGALRWSQTARGEQTVLMSVEVDGDAIFVAGHARGPASFAGAALQSGVFVVEMDLAGRAVRTSQCAADPGGLRYVRGLAVVRGRAIVVGLQDFGGRMEPFLWRVR
jgi:hypothetical protein